MTSPRIKTTVVGSYPVPDWLAAAPSEQGLIDATRVVIATQESAGVDVVCDGELYRFDLNHPETNGMIEYFVRPMTGIRHDMGFVAWKDAGLNTYGNTIIVNGDWLKKNKPVVAAFVKVTQKAFAACVTTPAPCVQALVEANGALQVENETTNWKLVNVLMRDKYSEGIALGILDDARMAADYDIVKTYLGLETPFDVKIAYTNEFLDRSIKMPK